MTHTHNQQLQTNNHHNGLILDIHSSNILPAVIGDNQHFQPQQYPNHQNQPLITLVQRNPHAHKLDELKRKVEHQKRITIQSQKLESQLDADFIIKPLSPNNPVLKPKPKRLNLSQLESSFAAKNELEVNTPIKSIKKPAKAIKPKAKINKKIAMVAGSVVTIMIVGGMVAQNLNQKQFNSTAQAGEVSSVYSQNADLKDKKESYSKWIKNSNKGVFLEANDDQDKDGLTNFEEFVIGSNPLSANSCNPNINDLENLTNLINPASCLGINLENPADIKKFGDIVSLPLIKKEIGTKKPLLQTQDNFSSSSKNTADIIASSSDSSDIES